MGFLGKMNKALEGPKLCVEGVRLFFWFRTLSTAKWETMFHIQMWGWKESFCRIHEQLRYTTVPYDCTPNNELENSNFYLIHTQKS